MLYTNEIIFQLGTIEQFDKCCSFDQHISSEFLRYKLYHEEIFLALDHNEISGYLRLDYLWGNKPYIGLIFVKDKFRGQHIGKGLLSFLEEYLRNKGEEKLYSSSQVNEPFPQRWHRKMGFSECGILNAVNDNGVGEIFFFKFLK